MKETTIKRKVGLDSINVSPSEARQEGFDVWQSDKGNYYAIVHKDIEIPETLEELKELLAGQGVEETGKEILSLAIKKYKRKYHAEPLYNETRAQLKKEVPAEVKSYIEDLISQAELGILPVSQEEIENIPYESKLSKQLVNEWIQNQI